MRLTVGCATYLKVQAQHTRRVKGHVPRDRPEFERPSVAGSVFVDVVDGAQNIPKGTQIGLYTALYYTTTVLHRHIPPETDETIPNIFPQT